MSVLRRVVCRAARFGWGVGAVALIAGCQAATDTVGIPTALLIVPDFGDLAVFADNADRLRIVITRLANNGRIVDDTVVIDPVTGEATAEYAVNLGGGPEEFAILLQAIRSADGMVLFRGADTVTVSTTSGGTPVTIPVSYAGPTGVRCVIGPPDTAIAPGASFTFRATVYDGANAVVPVPVTYALLNPADSVVLRVQKYTGVATAGLSTTGTVFVVARSADGLRDTARVGVGAVPAGIRVRPGFGVIGSGGTLQLTADVVDAAGGVVGPATGVTWTSRATGVAGVNAGGTVSGVAAGTAVIVGTATGFRDSTLVRVAAAQGEVPFSAVAGGRAFARVRTGDTVVVDVVADMNHIGGELLGSYNAQLDWSPSLLGFVSVQGVDFGPPTVNTSQTSTGVLRFSAADANGVGGTVVVARVRFVALGTGSGTFQLAVTEVSAALSFTNLLTFRTVTVGSVAVVP